MLGQSDDLNDIKTTGIYYFANLAPSNAPSGVTYAFVEVYDRLESIVVQHVHHRWSIYTRYYSGDSWKEWKAISPNS